MEIQNLNVETKIIIQDDFINNKIGISNDDNICYFYFPNIKDIKIDEYIIHNICRILFKKDTNEIIFYDDKNNDLLINRKIDFSEIFAFDFDEFCNLNIETEKIPLFISVGETEFPNFEIHTSGNMYSIDIYINEYTHMTINWYQSHDNLKDTLQYLSDLTEYLSSEPELLPNIFKHSTMEIVIGSSIEYEQRGIHDYELCDDGIKIIVPDGEPIVVDWHKFFKLVMDGTWDVKFIDSENKEI